MSALTLEGLAAALESSTAEMKRLMAESSAETERKLAESLAETERKLAESLAETERKLAASRAETERMNAETERMNAETERMNAETERMNAETERKLAASRAETERLMAASSAELAASMAETRRLMAESSAETDRKIAACIASMDRAIENMTGEFGRQGNKLGEIIELVIVPGIRLQMNALGHGFDRISANQKVRANRKVVAEIDVFLQNDVEAMAVEVKALLSEKDVKKHEARLKTLRMYEKRAEIKNKTLYGAVVGLVIDDDVKKAALERGLYVAKLIEHTDRLEIETPEHTGQW